MVSTLPRLITSFILSLFFILFSIETAFAQNFDFGFATYVPIKDPDVQDGSVVIAALDGMYLSRYPYDDTLAGVVSLKSAIVLGIKKEGTYPLNTKGNINVRVSTTNGPIKKGDLVTSSTIPGVAMLATKSGMVLGTAVEDFTIENPEEVGTVPVYLNIKFNEVGAKNKEFAVEKDVATWRLVSGGVLAVVVSVLCFYIFGKYSTKMIDGMARNPMAAKGIRRNMFIQGLILFIFVATGYAVAYFLIRG